MIDLINDVVEKAFILEQAWDCENIEFAEARANLNKSKDALLAEMERLEKRVSELEQENHWTPISDGLPTKVYEDIGDEILVKLDYPFERVAALKFDGTDFYSGGWGMPKTRWTERVTHWRELPKGPEVKS